MIRISHNIQIFSGPEAFMDFYNNYEKVFTELAPGVHLRFKFLGPLPVQIGTITESEEIMLGKYQKVKHRIIDFTPGRIVLKGIFPLSLMGGKLIFTIEKHEDYFVLFEILEFGFESFIGRLFDPVLKAYLRNKRPFLNNHSKETLSNIKSIIEKGQESLTLVQKQ